MRSDDRSRATASDRVYFTLLEEIQSGVLLPGASVAEVEQAERLGVSRTPLRAALSKLCAEGLLVQLSPRSTVVASIDRDKIIDLFEVRRSLEECAARLASQRGNKEVFEALTAEFDAVELDTQDNFENYYALIRRFDLELDAAVSNEYLISALRTVRTHLVRVRRMASERPERLRESVAEHRLIARAIAAGDQELAVHATHIHLHNALASILGHLEPQVNDVVAVSTV